LLQLRSVFEPQTVRAELPGVELPKELLRRLAEQGSFEAGDLPEGVDLQRLLRVSELLREQSARPVLDVIADVGQRLVVLLGDPGAGKSTVARYMMLALADQSDKSQLDALRGWLPLLVELRSYAQALDRVDTFVEFLDHRHATEGLGLPKEALEDYLTDNGRVAVG
jgi:predicted NACHT family NTPase